MTNREQANLLLIILSPFYSALANGQKDKNRNLINVFVSFRLERGDCV